MGQVEIGRDENHQPIMLAYDDELSFRDFTGWEFVSRPEYDFNNKVIYGSCFLQETPDSPIFGGPLENTTFYKCNLDNVLLE